MEKFWFIWNSEWLLIIFSKLVGKFCKSKWNAFCETETTGSKDPNQENKSLAHQCQILHANENWCMNYIPRWVVWIILLNKYSKKINNKNQQCNLPSLSSKFLFVIWNSASNGVSLGFVIFWLWCDCDDCCDCCEPEWCIWWSDNRLPLPISGEQQSLAAELLRSEPDSDFKSMVMFMFICRSSCAWAFKCSRCRW